jgi:hypothetical protein
MAEEKPEIKHNPPYLRRFISKKQFGDHDPPQK